MLKGIIIYPFMDADKVNEKLHDLVESLLGRRLEGRTILTSGGPPFDISRANIHNSKAEFQVEADAVDSIIEHAKAIMDVFLSDRAKQNPDHQVMVDRLRVAFQLSANKEMQKKGIGSANDLALKNVVQSGFYFNSIMVLLELFGAATERRKELSDQERDFWTVSNRPPNYYARSIALRLARLYAREKSERPTFGISSQGNYPSTEFGRTLEQVFEVLNIKANVKNAAVWAIDQLSEEDLRPPQNALLGGLLGVVPNEDSEQKSAVNALANYRHKTDKGSE